MTSSEKSPVFLQFLVCSLLSCPLSPRSFINSTLTPRPLSFLLSTSPVSIFFDTNKWFFCRIVSLNFCTNSQLHSNSPTLSSSSWPTKCTPHVLELFYAILIVNVCVSQSPLEPSPSGLVSSSPSPRPLYLPSTPLPLPPLLRSYSP